MELHSTIIYIHQQQVVKKKIFDKVILIKMFLIGNDKILDLESGKLSDHCHILIAAHDDHILYLIIIVDFEIHAAFDFLRIRLRFGKAHNIRSINIVLFFC